MAEQTDQKHTDQLTLEQEEQIRLEIVNSQPIISNVLQVNDLLQEYSNAELPGFVLGINYLSKKYSHVRKVRGDGNCFYRAFLFCYLENLLTSHLSNDAKDQEKAETERIRMIMLIHNSMQDLTTVGYSENAVDMFQEEMLDLMTSLFTNSVESLLEKFQEGGMADYYTWFMRLLTAGKLKQDADRFMPFIEGNYFDMNSFCAGEVEPMNKECEQIQIIALTEYLNVPVAIEYLDGRTFSESEGLSRVVLPDGCSLDNFSVKLLYRPGHYDILYGNV